MSNRALYPTGHNTARHGAPNPKTLVPPVMSRRLNDFDAWNNSATAVKSGINTQNAINLEPFIEHEITRDRLSSKPRLDNKKRYYLDERQSTGNDSQIPSSSSFMDSIQSVSSGVMNRAMEAVGYGNSEGFRKRDRDKSTMGDTDSFSYHKLRRDQTVPPQFDEDVALKNIDYRSGFVDLPQGNNGYDKVDYDDTPGQFPMSSNLSLRDYGMSGPEPLENFKSDLHTSRIQPGSYYKNEYVEPINSNIGISYLPSYQYVEKIPEDAADGNGYLNNNTNYTFTRIDPQLVRDNEVPNRADENPARNNWSQKFSNIEAAPGTVSESDIYDPRHTGSGDGYRSYVDTQLGQVRYYYSDVDVIRKPNYIMRSKIDSFDFVTPMGAVQPDYIRTPLEENSRELAETKFLRDSISHRESLMGSQMKKMNTNYWQRRHAPIRQF